MDKAEKLALSSSLPQLLEQVIVNTRFKAGILSSSVLDSDYLDNLFDGKAGQELVFDFINKLRRANEPGSFQAFVQVLRNSGQNGAADVLDSELIKHTQQLSQTSVERANMLSDGVAISEIRNTSVTADDSEDEDHAARGNYPTEPQKQLSDGNTNTQELQDAVRHCMEKDSDKIQSGDIAILKRYYEVITLFKRGKSTAHPGPLQVPDVTRRSYCRDELYFISPSCSSQLSKLLGGKPTVVRDSSEGHPILKTLNGKFVYCVLGITFQPGKVKHRGCWVSVDHTLKETLTDNIEWPQYCVRNPGATENLNLGMTGLEWYPNSPNMHVHVWRASDESRSLTLEEKQQLVRRSLKMPSHRKCAVPVLTSYYRKLQSFGKGHVGTSLEPLQVPNIHTEACNEQNLDFVAPEACATFIELFGGEDIQLRKSTRRGSVILVDPHSHATHIGVLLYSQYSDNKIGGYYLSTKLSLRDAISAATGCVPQKAKTTPTSVDLDLDITVRAWYSTALHVRIYVWFNL